MSKTADRAIRILDIAKDMAEKLSGHGVRHHLEEIQLHMEGYSEPGYSDPECGVIATGNWNDYKGSDLCSRISNLFEKMGIELEWNDEWFSCNYCGKLVRNAPDSHWWKPSYVMGDGEIECHECIKKDPEGHLKSLEGNYDTCNTIDRIYPGQHSYIKLNPDLKECKDCDNECEFETGWCGRNDSPQAVAKALEAKGIDRYLFNLEENEQFRSTWSVYVHSDEKDKL